MARHRSTSASGTHSPSGLPRRARRDVRLLAELLPVDEAPCFGWPQPLGRLRRRRTRVPRRLAVPGADPPRSIPVRRRRRPPGGRRPSGNASVAAARVDVGVRRHARRCVRLKVVRQPPASGISLATPSRPSVAWEASGRRLANSTSTPHAALAAHTLSRAAPAARTAADVSHRLLSARFRGMPGRPWDGVGSCMRRPRQVRPPRAASATSGRRSHRQPVCP